MTPLDLSLCVCVCVMDGEGDNNNAMHGDGVVGKQRRRRTFVLVLHVCVRARRPKEGKKLNYRRRSCRGERACGGDEGVRRDRRESCARRMPPPPRRGGTTRTTNDDGAVVFACARANCPRTAVAGGVIACVRKCVFGLGRRINVDGRDYDGHPSPSPARARQRISAAAAAARARAHTLAFECRSPRPSPHPDRRVSPSPPFGSSRVLFAFFRLRQSAKVTDELLLLYV